MMLEFVSDLRAGDLGIVVALGGGWCRRCLGVLGWLPCGATGALAGVLGIFWFSASGGVGAGCSPRRLLSFSEALEPVLVLLVSGCCGRFWICCSEVLERSK